MARTGRNAASLAPESGSDAVYLQVFDAQMETAGISAAWRAAPVMRNPALITLGSRFCWWRSRRRGDPRQPPGAARALHPTLKRTRGRDGHHVGVYIDLCGDGRAHGRCLVLHWRECEAVMVTPCSGSRSLLRPSTTTASCVGPKTWDERYLEVVPSVMLVVGPLRHLCWARKLDRLRGPGNPVGGAHTALELQRQFTALSTP